jgi:hypothetical protein
MSRLLVLLTFLFCSSFVTKAQDDTPGTNVEAIVTMHIADLTNAQWGQLTARIGKEPSMNVEYNCLRTCVVVLRMQHLQASDKADVIQVVKRLLKEAAVPGAVQFLDVHVEPEGGNKC